MIESLSPSITRSFDGELLKESRTKMAAEDFEPTSRRARRGGEPGGGEREEEGLNIRVLFRPLYFNHSDFNFICETVMLA